MDNTDKSHIKEVKNALELEKSLSKIKNPDPPVKKVIQREKPPIEKLKSNKFLAFGPAVVAFILTFLFGNVPVLSLILYVVGFLTVIWIPYYYFSILPKERTDYEERVRNSKAYQTKCAEYENKYNEMQAKENEAFRKAYTEYENIVIENEQRISGIKAALNELYARIGSIPVQYRNVEAMSEIYNTISSSNYSVEEAVTLYERKLQRLAEEERLRRQREEEEARLRRQREEEEAMYENQANSGSSGGGLIRDTAVAAAGSYIGTHGIKKEMRNVSRSIDKAAKEQQKEAEKQANDARRRAARESQRQYYKVIDENKKRRQKGLPELPLPPVDWY